MDSPDFGGGKTGVLNRVGEPVVQVLSRKGLTKGVRMGVGGAIISPLFLAGSSADTYGTCRNGFSTILNILIRACAVLRPAAVRCLLNPSEAP